MTVQMARAGNDSGKGGAGRAAASVVGSETFILFRDSIQRVGSLLTRIEHVKTAHSVRRNGLGDPWMSGSLLRKHGDGLCSRPGGDLEKNAMPTRRIHRVVRGGVVTAVLVVCSLAILTSNAKLESRDNEFSVSIREKHRIRSAGFERPQSVYNCRASAKACALAAVQQMCGNDRYEITFADIYVGADGQLEGEWGYRCLSSRREVL
jgi:hypothetical protein